MGASVTNTWGIMLIMVSVVCYIICNVIVRQLLIKTCNLVLFLDKVSVNVVYVLYALSQLIYQVCLFKFEINMRLRGKTTLIYKVYE